MQLQWNLSIMAFQIKDTSVVRTAIETCGALVQFGCYQHRYEWKDLWCSSTVQLLSTQI